MKDLSVRGGLPRGIVVARLDDFKVTAQSKTGRANMPLSTAETLPNNTPVYVLTLEDRREVAVSETMMLRHLNDIDCQGAHGAKGSGEF